MFMLVFILKLVGATITNLKRVREESEERKDERVNTADSVIRSF